MSRSSVLSRVLPSQRQPVTALCRHVAGTVALPGSTEYEELARPWNVAVPVQPTAVVAVRDAADVVAVVRFARAHRLSVSPQATGHGAVAGLVGEVVVQTGGLDECVVHPEGWARVGAGVKWARVVAAAAEHGLAPLNGSSSDVGVVGYLTGGGLGPMARTYGLGSDRVRALEVVTGDGELRRATPTEHPELFFGLRGGKGALGIVTAVEFDLVEQPAFYGGGLYFDGDDVREVLHAWRTWSADLPEQATTSIALLQLPPLPQVPPPLAGRLSVAVRFLWTGDTAEGERQLAPLRSCGRVLLDAIGEHPYTAVDLVHADPVDPMPVHEDATLLGSFPADAADALLEATRAGNDQVIVEVRQLGGATARPGAHPSAFCQRGAAFSLLTIGIAVVPGVPADGARIMGALQPWSTGGMLPNFAPTADHAARCYDTETLGRLRSAVRAYDPDSVLSLGRALGQPAEGGRC